MVNINRKIDEYFYPQSIILRYFNIPKEFYKYKVEDYRRYFWNIDNPNHQIDIGIGFRNDCLCGAFGRHIVDVNGWVSCENIKAILIVNPFVEYNKSFIFLDSYKELVYENDKYHIKEQKTGICINVGNVNI